MGSVMEKNVLDQPILGFRGPTLMELDGVLRLFDHAHTADAHDRQIAVSSLFHLRTRIENI